jgi:hypothetical protein
MKKAAKRVVIPAGASLLVWSVGSTALAGDRAAVALPRGVQGFGLVAQAAGQAQAPVLIATDKGQTKAGFTFSKAVVEGGSGIRITNGEGRSAFGSTWRADVKATLPPAVGPYVGAVTLTDAKTGQVLTVVPVELR